MSQLSERDREGFAWQRAIWDRYPEIYRHVVDRRFAPVVEQVITRAALQPGQHVLDLGTGTGAVAIQAAPLIRPSGEVLGVDISPEMLTVAQERAAAVGLTSVRFREGRAESSPAEDAHFHVVLASLSLMYAIDRAAAAREIARLLRPGGRVVAAAWAGPEQCDIVLFQQTAGRFAPLPPVPGVGPGALADPPPFLQQLSDAGLEAHIETEMLGFDFHDMTAAWTVLARVTTAQLPPERQQEAQAAVRATMWPQGDGPRHFHNLTNSSWDSDKPNRKRSHCVKVADRHVLLQCYGNANGIQRSKHSLHRKITSDATIPRYYWVAPMVVAHRLHGVSHRGADGRTVFGPHARTRTPRPRPAPDPRRHPNRGRAPASLRL